MIVEINGEKYIEKERPKSSYRMPPALFTVVTAAMMMGGGGEFMPRERNRPNVDIVKEYGLIQLKKSNLTKSGRDWVVDQFERNFTKVIN